MIVPPCTTRVASLPHAQGVRASTAKKDSYAFPAVNHATVGAARLPTAILFVQRYPPDLIAIAHVMVTAEGEHIFDSMVHGDIVV